MVRDMQERTWLGQASPVGTQMKKSSSSHWLGRTEVKLRSVTSHSEKGKVIPKTLYGYSRGQGGRKGEGLTHVTCSALSPISVSMPMTLMLFREESDPKNLTRSQLMPSLQDHRTEETAL